MKRREPKDNKANKNNRSGGSSENSGQKSSTSNSNGDRESKQTSQHGRSNNGGSSSRTNQSSKPDSKASSSDAKKTYTPFTPKDNNLTKEAYEDHMSKGLCFNCHEHGHMTRKCPKSNVVKSSRKDGKVPGMKIHSIALGLEENDEDLQEDDGLTVMDSLPMHMMDVDDFYVSDDEPPALQNVSDSETKELDLDLGFDEAARDALEFPWLIPDPEKIARKQIGDALAMKATYVLARSQPYPGDDVWVAQDRGVIHRFRVTKRDEETYVIHDSLFNQRLTVPTWRLIHPNFRLGRYYARHRAAQLDRISIGSYALTMGHALEEVATDLLRDG
ncbi:hypothetical protein BKA70DRAFT_1121912, partial [Coprinopsis sp. MPI-PUGE-AT-0042]